MNIVRRNNMFITSRSERLMVVILVESLVLKFTLPLMRFEERLPRNTLYDHTQTMLICIFLRKRFKFLKQLKRYHTRVLRVVKNEIIFLSCLKKSP